MDLHKSKFCDSLEKFYNLSNDKKQVIYLNYILCHLSKWLYY